MSPQAKISSNPNFCYAQRNRTYDKTSWVYVSMYVFERSDPGLTPEIYQQMKCPLGVSNWNDRITFSSFASANCILSCPGRSGTWGSGLASACPNTASWSLQYPSLHPLKGVQMHFAHLCTKKIMEKLYKALVQLSLIRNHALGFLTFEEFTALKRAFGSTGFLIDSDRSLNHLHPTWIIR